MKRLIVFILLFFAAPLMASEPIKVDLKSPDIEIAHFDIGLQSPKIVLDGMDRYADMLPSRTIRYRENKYIQVNDKGKLLAMFVVGSGSGGTVYDLSDFTFWWDCEVEYGPTAGDLNNTNGGVNYSAGDDIESANGGATINNDVTVVSGNNWDFPNNADYITFNPASICTDDDLLIGFAIKVTTWATAGTIFSTGDAPTTAGIVFGFAGGTTGLAMSYLDGSEQDGYLTVGGSGEFSTGTTYYVILVSYQSGGDIYAYVYNTSKSIVDSGSDEDTGLTAMTGTYMRIGNLTANTPDFAMDNIRVCLINGDLSGNLATMLATMDSSNYSSP